MPSSVRPPGALIQATTSSGTNQFHGTLFEFLRNNVTNAADPFTLQNPPIRWNQFGGSVGAPIRRNSMFGVLRLPGNAAADGRLARHHGADGSGTRRRSDRRCSGNYICAGGSVSELALRKSVPGADHRRRSTTAARAGMVFNPATRGYPAAAGARRYTQGRPAEYRSRGGADREPAERSARFPITAATSSITTSRPAASTSTATSTTGASITTSSTLTTCLHATRIANFNNYSPAAFGDLAGGPSAFNFSGDSVDRNQSVAVGVDHALSPTLQTDVRFGFYRYRIRVQPNGVGTTPATDAGLPGLNTGTPETSGMPAFYINGNGGFDFGYALGVNQCNCPLRRQRIISNS